MLVAFLSATGLTYLATGVPVVPAVAILVLIGIAVADWAFGLDGQFVSHWLEKKARSRVKHWLEQFAASDPGASVDDERTER